MPNVIGVFEDSSQAQQAVERMMNDHIERNQISLVTGESDRAGARRAPNDRAADQLVGALTDMGVPEEEARRYEDQVRQGKVLVTVRSEDDSAADRVASIMAVEGAEDIEGAGERGNVEAAPEYEGARSDETGDTPTKGEQRQNLPSGRGRIRVYGNR